MNQYFQYEKTKYQLDNISIGKDNRKLPYEILEKIKKLGGNIHPVHPNAKKLSKKMNRCSSCFGSAFFILPLKKRFAYRLKTHNYVRHSSARMIYDYIKIYKSPEYRRKMGEHIYDIDILIVGRAIRNRIRI